MYHVNNERGRIGITSVRIRYRDMERRLSAEVLGRVMAWGLSMVVSLNYTLDKRKGLEWVTETFAQN